MSYCARHFGTRLNPGFTVAGLLLLAALPQLAAADRSPPSRTAARAAPASEDPALTQFHKLVEPILQERCYDCHGDGSSRAGLAFDDLVTEGKVLHNPEVWFKVLRNTRSHIMPPADHPPPTAAEQLVLEQWIKTAGLGLNPAQPDPGRVTVRRLNRTEYHNSIRDLLGVDFDVEAAFPGDDLSYSFDNITVLHSGHGVDDIGRTIGGAGGNLDLRRGPDGQMRPVDPEAWRKAGYRWDPGSNTFEHIPVAPRQPRRPRAA